MRACCRAFGNSALRLEIAAIQRADRNRTHGQLLSWMRLMTPPSSRQADMPAIDDLSLVTAPSGRPPLQRAIAQRFSAMAPLRHADARSECLFIGVERKSSAHGQSDDLRR